jgi:hypothetical protein
MKKTSIKDIIKNMERHYILDLFCKGTVRYSHRMDIVAPNLYEALQQTLDIIPKSESELGTLDRIELLTNRTWGSLIVWKKLKGGLIAKILVPPNAKRMLVYYHLTHVKFEFGKVLKIFDGSNEVQEGRSIADPELIFRIGEMVSPNDYTHDVRGEPSPGLYACLTRHDAEMYQVND